MVSSLVRRHLTGISLSTDVVLHTSVYVHTECRISFSHCVPILLHITSHRALPSMLQRMNE